MIRALVADDSPTTRALLRDLLEAAGDFVVVGEAADGREAVEACERLRPDVVTMDLAMPRMDGFEATKEIMIKAPTPIVIVSSRAGDSHEAEAAVRALRAGAVSVLRKPPGPGVSGFEAEGRVFVETVRAMASVKVVRHFRRAAPAGSVRAQKGGDAAPAVVAIVASTGGPAALQAVLSVLPVTFPLPVLVVQHITEGFTEGLCAWLKSVCSLQVKVARQGEALAGHTVYLAPCGAHLEVRRGGYVQLTDAPPVRGFRPSGSALFRSAAETYGAGVVAIILTGMGEDGVDGLRAVRAAGGIVIAQDERTSVVYGMPSAAISAGLATYVAPLDGIAARLLEFI